MKAIILAAGRGSRMGILTDSLPKPLIPYKGKPLLSYKLEALPPQIDEVFIGIGYKGELIREAIGDTFTHQNGEKLAIHYVEHEGAQGTGGTIRCILPHIGSEPALVLMGDDVYSSEDLQRLCDDAAAGHWAMLFHMGLDDTFTYTGACIIDASLLETPAVAIKGGAELGLPQTIAVAAMEKDVEIRLRFTQNWRKFNTPEDLSL